MRTTAVLLLLLATSLSAGQAPSQPNWTAVEEETLRHFQAMVRMDTTDPPGTPPGGEKPVADYLKQVLEKEGIPVEIFALEPNRPNVVARLKGNGKKKPLLILGPHRHGERGRQEVDLPAVQRRAQRRLHLRARHRRRQGQPGRDADDDADC